MSIITQISNSGKLHVESGVLSFGPELIFTNWSLTDFVADIGWTFSNENLTLDHTGGQLVAIRSTRNDLKTGKHYWEITVTISGSNSDAFFGVKERTASISEFPSVVGSGGGPWAVWRLQGDYEDSTAGPDKVGTAANIGGSLPVTLMFALDLDNGKFWCGVDGVWNSGGDPAAGTDEDFNNFPNLGTTEWAAFFATDNQNPEQESTANFGGTPFAYAVPTGFSSGISG